MSAQILDGRAAADAVLESLKPSVAELDPRLVVVQVGEDPASSSYIKQKKKSCDAVGMRNEHRHLAEDISEEQLRGVIDDLNHDDDVTGFFVQLPLPSHLKSLEPLIPDLIHPSKDVDGFGAVNMGQMMRSKEYEVLPPATPSGIILMLEHYNIPIEGKHAVVVGRSTIVGKPVSFMLLNRSATVTICHSKTVDLGAITSQADILIAAAGKPKMISADMVKDAAVVVDVGINRTDDRLCGDVDFDVVAEKASAITPVPGGVGPMTVASLLRNCVQAAQMQRR